MNKLLCFLVLLNTAIFSPVVSFSQYILNGNATKESCNCYVLTEAVANKSGTVWENKRINLNDSFDFSFNVFLGCLPEGADGMVFILQPLSTNIGSTGEGLGFGGISPSIGISLDTYRNVGDPDFDHITIQANGVVSHANDLAGPVPASASSNDIKDCAWHNLRIKWDPSTNTLSTFFDGVPRLSLDTDLVSNIFKDDPWVYWGFSGSTGSHFNIQKFCTPLDSKLNTGLLNDAVCAGSPVTFKDSSSSFTTIKSFFWDFGDGNISHEPDPQHVYEEPGIYQVRHSFTSADNCESELYTREITIGDKPKVTFQISDTCEGLPPRVAMSTTVKYGTINEWEWKIDDTDYSTIENPDFSKLLPGTHAGELKVASDIGCESGAFGRDFKIYSRPVINFLASDGCINAPVSFVAQQTDQVTAIENWKWNFGDNLASDKKNVDHIYERPGNYQVQLTAITRDGCTSSVNDDIFINSVQADAGNDTVVVANTSFQLKGSGGTYYLWSPSAGLNNPGISNPVANLSNDMNYLLTVKTAEGCTDTASVKVTIFDGSAVYVPNAFTPNNDGLNDVLKPYMIGIKSLYYFTVYNRWGQKVFSTNSINEGWNGFSQGKIYEAGSYVWVLKAVDLIGKVYDLKGQFVLIK